MTTDRKTAFGDTIKISLNKDVTVEELRRWKKEIINQRKPIPIEGITILFFKEIK